MIFVQMIFECYRLNYTDCTGQPQSSWQVHITQHGFQNYIDANKDISTSYINSLQLPEIVQHIGGFQIRLMDMHVVQYSPPDVQIQYLENNKMIIKVDNVSLKLSLKFGFTQISYPYLNDYGDGYIQLSNISASVLANPYNDSTTCPFHFKINITDSFTQVNQINVKLNGKLEFLYDSLLNLLTNQLQKEFNKELGIELIKTITFVTNMAIESDINTISSTKPYLYSDQRYTGIEIQNSFFICKNVGQVLFSQTDPNFNKNTEITGYTNQLTVQQFSDYFTNNDIQYHIHRLTFQSMFNNLYTHIFNETNHLKMIKPANTIKFAHTGLLVEYQLNDFNVQYLLKINMTWRIVTQLLNITQLIPIIQQQVQCSGNEEQCSSQQLNEFVEKLNEYYEIYAPQYSNANGIHKCDIIYHEDDWLLGVCDVLRK